MLSMKKIDKIRSMYFDEGMCLSDIARKTKFSSNTISKYVKNIDYNSRPRKPKADTIWKILPYEEDIAQWLKLERGAHHKQRLTGKRIFDLLKEKYPDFPCSYYLTQKFFKNKRREFFALNKQYIPLKHSPGCTQADFGEIHYIRNNERHKGYLLTVAFPYSNAVYCQIFKGKSAECLLQGLKNIFHHIGGVPYEIKFDNDTAIVRINDEHSPKTKTPTELFLRFKNHYNFRVHFCNSRSHNEKASVEFGIHAIRQRLLAHMPEIENIDEFNKELLASCDSGLSRCRKGRKNIVISDLFEIDKSNLLPLPEVDFEVVNTKKRLCDNMGRVIISGVYHYYLSPRYNKKKVIVKTYYDKVAFLDEYERFICESERLYNPNGATSVNWGEYFKLLSIKIAALEHCAVLGQFPETLREFILDSDKKTKKNYMQIMHEIYIKAGFDAAVQFANEMAEECVTEYPELERIAAFNIIRTHIL